jgi:cytochrome c oxidase subunit 2
MLVKSLLALLLSVSFSYSAIAKEANTPHGFEYCTVCHGSQLKGNSNIGAPRLTQLSPWYLNRQLMNFKKGLRGNHSEDETGNEMMSMASTLSDENIKDIVKWITTTESLKPEPTIKGNAQSGKALYSSCTACHGVQAGGNKALGAPKLQGLNDWYILTQLNHFREGIRGTNKSDTYGQQMKAASAVVTSKEDAANLAAYIQQLK